MSEDSREERKTQIDQPHLVEAVGAVVRASATIVDVLQSLDGLPSIEWHRIFDLRMTHTLASVLSGPRHPHHTHQEQDPTNFSNVEMYKPSGFCGFTCVAYTLYCSAMYCLMASSNCSLKYPTSRLTPPFSLCGPVKMGSVDVTSAGARSHNT